MFGYCKIESWPHKKKIFWESFGNRTADFYLVMHVQGRQGILSIYFLRSLDLYGPPLVWLVIHELSLSVSPRWSCAITKISWANIRYLWTTVFKWKAARGKVVVHFLGFHFLKELKTIQFNGAALLFYANWFCIKFWVKKILNFKPRKITTLMDEISEWVRRK